MRLIVTDRVVAWSVWLSVRRDREPCKNDWTDRDYAIWDVASGGPRKHMLDGVHIAATWRIRSNRPRAAAMWPYVKLLSTTCFVRCRGAPKRRGSHRSIGPVG